jgi:UDP-glucose 4-epimerase
MRVVVTGGAGFIGSNVVEALTLLGHSVCVIDNFSTGQRAFLDEAGFLGDVVELDLVGDPPGLHAAMEGADVVIHFAANADVRYGWSHPTRDLEQNLIATLNVCEAMRAVGARRLIFSSTGSVYGEPRCIPTPEAVAFPVQTSLYGASKAAAEGFLGAYAEAGHLDVTVFRFVSILGRRYSHGHVIDFMRKLRQDPARLEILGDGLQRKSYLDVEDCTSAILARLADSTASGIATYNLGVDSYCTVLESASWISERLGLAPKLEPMGGRVGWVGDNPFIYLDTALIRETGWLPRYTIREAVERTVDYLMARPWLVEQRMS